MGIAYTRREQRKLVVAVRGIMMVNAKTTLVSCCLAITCLVAAAQATAKTRADCERVYKPTFGQPGKDVAWEPTSPEIAAAMLQMAATTAHDRVYDLGAGDGSIVIVAAKQFGATAIGVEYNPKLVTLAQCYIDVEGVADKAKVIQGDIFQIDFSSATVVTLFLYPELNLRLRPMLLNLRPGTRVVSHLHKMGDWQWDAEIEREGRKAYLWIIPAKVQGVWQFSESGSTDEFQLTLKQAFQKLTGHMDFAGTHAQVSGALRGAELKLDLGRQRQLIGMVEGTRIVANVTTGGVSKHYVGVKQ